MLAPRRHRAAEESPAPPPPVEPVQPVLAWIYPAGGQRGTTFEVTASGTSIVPETVLVTGGGVTGKVMDGSTPSKAKFSLTIAPDAEPGERELRILNAGGISNRFRFIVGELHEITEVEPNNEKTAPQKLPALPVVIDGQILENDRDYFRFSAKAGETLVFSVQARSLLPFIADAVPGWFDPQLTVYDAAGKQVAFADDHRFLPDPVLFFRAARRWRVHARTARHRLSRPRRFRLPPDHGRAALCTRTSSRSADSAAPTSRWNTAASI